MAPNDTFMSISSSAVLNACTSPLVLSGSSIVPSMSPSSVPLVAQWRTSTMRAMALRPAPSVENGRSGDCVIIVVSTP